MSKIIATDPPRAKIFSALVSVLFYRMALICVLTMRALIK